MILTLSLPALAAEEKPETIHGTCISGSHASLRTPGTDKVSRPFPVYCDTATIATGTGIRITFAGRTAKRPISFEGTQQDATHVRLTSMQLRKDETTQVGNGECTFGLVDGLVSEITCKAKVAGDRNDTVVVAFTAKYGR